MSTETRAPQRTSESHRRALAVLSTVLFVTFLDNTIVSVTLADVQSDLHAGIQTLQWTVNGYALAFASLMLVGGMLGDLYGRRRVMVAGLALFSAGSVIAALAPSAPWLLAGRVVMGIGAAGSEPGTLSIIRHLYQERESRARAFGVWAAVSGTALAMGPVVAGVLVGFWSWRAVFWFNLVIGGAALVATRLLVPESSDPEGAPLDISGSVLGATALAAAIFAVIGGETAGYTTWWIIALFVLSGAAAVSFVVVELHTERPMLDITLLRRARFTVSNVVAFTTYFGIFSIFFFVALYLQLLADRSPLATALDFVPMTVLMIAGSALAGRWVARSGPHVPMTVGCALAGIGILSVDVVLGPDVGFAQLSWSMGIAGAGFGIALVPVVSAAMSSVRQERSGMAASATNTSRQLGAVFGVAILGAVVNGQLNSNLVSRLQELGVPPNFQSVVINAVTHGGVPDSAQQAQQQNAAAAAAPGLVEDVISAAERAFYSGLHLALLISSCLLLASAVLVWVTFRSVDADLTKEGFHLSRATVLRAVGLTAVLVGAAVALELAVEPARPAPDTSGSSATTTTTSTQKTGGDTTSTTAASKPSITVNPSDGIQAPQSVDVTGKGFPADTSLVIVQCADVQSTSAADCDLTHAGSVTSNASGEVSASLVVRSGPFGSANRVCDPDHDCLVTVSRPSGSADAARATAPIHVSA